MSMMSCQVDHGARCCCHGKFIRTGMRIFVWKTVEGLTRAFKWSDLVHKARGCRVAFFFRLLWAGTFFSRKKKNKQTKNTWRCAQSIVRQSCSRNNVVEPVGKTFLALDTVLGHDLEKDKHTIVASSCWSTMIISKVLTACLGLVKARG